MPKTRPTGFLDLPLELRLQIYGYTLPADRIMNFPESHQRLNEEKTVIALCATDPQVNEELEDVVFKNCSAHITVEPHIKTGLPPAMEWDRFQLIDVTINYFQDHSKPERWAGMEEFVNCLRHGKPRVLPHIRTRFREDGNAWVCGDRKWTEDVRQRSSYCWRGPIKDCCCGHNVCHVCHDRYLDPIEDVSDQEEGDDSDDDSVGHWYSESKDSWLRTTGDCYGNPVAIEILDYLLELPPCKTAFVHILKGLEDRRSGLSRHDPKRRIFDRLYMEDLCDALGIWLEGDRDGIKLPAGISQDHGEPRLEQIAYQKRKGQYYCTAIRYPKRQKV